MAAKRTKSTRRKTTSRSRGRYDPADDLPEERLTRRGATQPRRASPAPASRRKRSTPARRKAYYPPDRFSLLRNISPARRVDLLGAIMVLLGLLTLLSLFSANRSALSGDWVNFLTGVFGWGVYILPLALILLGAWLVARNVDRLPALTLERLLGILLLFTGLLPTFHAISSLSPETLGQGGGSLGSLVARGLQTGLGAAGAFIVILAWLIIALAMTIDISMQEMFRWLGPLGQRIANRFKRQPAALPLTHGAPPASGEPLGHFTPLIGRPAESQPAPGSASANQPTVRTGVSSAPVIAWVLPRVADILEKPLAPVINEEFIEKRARLIEETLASFGAPGQVVEISRGPAVTMYGVEPLFIESRGGPMRVRVGKIAALSDDLALALAAPRIRIQAPVPGRGYVGIEVPNEEMALVALREIVESDSFTRGRSTLRFALGKDVAGKPVSASIDSMPHMLIAGTTGSGKSVCVNSILSCFLLHNTPDDLRIILVDPKRVELTGYNGVPHLLAPVVVEIERVIGALQWMTREMDNRYHKFAEVGARNIVDYNGRMLSQGARKLPYLLIVIDELADLMMIAPDETERTITRLAQLARATGIHMILATQRPSVDVVTGLIKANFPARIAFAVASNTDSRVILDQPGAERLLGRGDMLFQAPDAPAPVRLQGVFVSDVEITRLVDFWREQASAVGPYAAAGTPGITTSAASQGPPLRPPDGVGKQVPMFEDITAPQEDPVLADAIDTCRREGRCSVSMLQRKLRIGYTRAARLVDTMEEKGIVGSPEPGTGVREVLDYGPAAPPKEE